MEPPTTATQLPETPTRPFLYQALRQRPVLDVRTSRGCTRRCAFCLVGAAYRAPGAEAIARWRPRAPQEIASEIDELIQQTDVRRIHFIDDNFIGTQKAGRLRAFEIAELLAPLDVRFSLYCRADVVEHNLFGQLVTAGLRQVYIGLESGSDAVLARLHKDVSTDRMTQAVTVLRQLGIRIVPSFIVFEQRQSINELERSLSWMKKQGLEDGFSTGGLVPLPGTLIFDQLARENLINDDTGWQAVFSPVKFSYARVAAVAQAVRELERLVDEADGSVYELACAYHRFNNYLDCAEPGAHDNREQLHHHWRVFQVDKAIHACLATAEGQVLEQRLVAGWHKEWREQVARLNVNEMVEQ